MDGDRVSINIDDHEIREQRRARQKALELVKKPHREAKSKCHAYPLLRAAAEEGNTDKFNEALKKCSAEEVVSSSDIMDIQGPSGDLLLHVAAGFEKDHILHAPLGFIGDKQLATKVNYRGDTVLHVTPRAGRIHTAMLLLGCDGIMDWVNDMGNTALHEAVKNCHFELTHLLLNRGSKSVVKQVNQESKWPLYLAVETGDLAILVRLIEAVDGKVQGISPVHGAVMHHKLGH